MKKLLAFTLSETLITLAVVGIVAALTLPNLATNYKTKSYISKMQKVYNQLSNAALSLKTDTRVDSLADTYLGDDAASIRTFFNDYIKIANDCGTENRTDCFAAQYKNTDKTNYDVELNGYCITTNAGAGICIGVMENGVSPVVVDINGPKVPNTLDRDLYVFELNEDGTVGGGNLDTLINSGWEISE